MTAAAGRTVTVIVELTVIDDRDGHVEGTVALSGREPEPFAGWLALLELLERSTVDRGART